MATANFNTQIVSSSNNEILEYNLDEVITKDFLGNPGYSYGFSNLPLVGVTIEEGIGDGTYLIIDPLLEFDLSILVFNNDKFNPINVIVTTRVTIEGGGKPIFSNEVTKFFDNPNYTQNKDNIKQNWSFIISNRISSGDLVDGPDRPIS